MEIGQTAHASPAHLDFWTEFSVGLLYLSEIIWSSAVFTILFNYPGQIAHIGLIFGLLGFTGYLITRLLFAMKVKKQTQIFFLGLWICCALLVILKSIVYAESALNIFQLLAKLIHTLPTLSSLQSQLWQMIFGVFVIKRSFTLASSTTNSWRANRSFQVGMLMFLFYGLTTLWDHILASLLPFLAYLVTILLALNTARLSELSQYKNSSSQVFTKSWILWGMSLALIIVGFGSLIGWLFGITFVSFTEQILQIIYGIGAALLSLLFAPFIALAVFLLPWINKLIASLAEDQLGNKQLEFIQSLNQPDPQKAARLTITLNQWLVIVLIVTLIASIVITLFYLKNRRQNSNKQTSEIQMDSHPYRKENRKKRFGSNLFRSIFDQSRRWMAAARIRRIYQQLMEYCIKLDQPRLPAVTPLEFLPELLQLFPECDQELKLITDTYQRVRYGEIPENMEEMQKIYSAWNIVKPKADLLVKERSQRLKKR